MKTQEIKIGHIPAVLWGVPQKRLIIAVHGDQSSKRDPIIALLAEAAAGKGCQVLSFDLPGHGERDGDGERLNAQTCVPELLAVLRYAEELAPEIGLFGCSLGAYFSLMAYREMELKQALFLSPVVDMSQLIERMMGWSNLKKEQLEEEKIVKTPIGKTLYWDDYRYTIEHPVDRWQTPTAILYGEKDELSAFDGVSSFCRRFSCELTVMEGGEHWFHTEEQLAFYRSWLDEKLKG